MVTTTTHPPAHRSPEKLAPSEWFIPFRADTVPHEGKKLTFTADAAQRAAIAERIGVRSVESLEARLRLTLENSGHILHIAGDLFADVTQSCTVTLEPIVSHIEDSFDAWYADHEKVVPFSRIRHDAQKTLDGEEVQMSEEKDDPEPLTDGQVDLGEVIVQFFSLAIDPYPRKDGVAFESDDGTEVVSPKAAKAAGTASLRPNPFAALKNWRPKD